MAKQNFSVARIETRTRATVGKFERHIERKNDSYENMNEIGRASCRERV